MSPLRTATWTRRRIQEQYTRLMQPGVTLTQVASDIWVTRSPVAAHCDSTERGLVCYGLVLINDIDLELHYRGGIFPLKVGDAYCINGHEDHAALHPGGGAKRDGLFAVRVWDIPPGLSLARFVEQARREEVEWTQ